MNEAGDAAAMQFSVQNMHNKQTHWTRKRSCSKITLYHTSSVPLETFYNSKCTHIFIIYTKLQNYIAKVIYLSSV